LDVEQGATPKSLRRDEVREAEDHYGEEVYELSGWQVREDIYGFAAVALVRDTYLLTIGKGNLPIRRFRLTWSLTLLFFNTMVQAFLVESIRKYVVSASVQHVQELYSAYEKDMYGDHVFHIDNVGFRGEVGQIASSEIFMKFQTDRKKELCQIPLSQPSFCFVILLVWAMTCACEIKAALVAIWKYSVVPTVSSMSRAIRRTDDDDVADSNTRYLVGVTNLIRTLIIVFTCLPQLAISVLLLWLGSRWLISTNDFSDLVLNAAALEFVINIKELSFRSMVSDRSKLDMQTTKILLSDRKEVATPTKYLGGLTWMLVSCLWVYTYMFHLQIAIPGYRFDVHTVCEEWVTKEFLR